MPDLDSDDSRQAHTLAEQLGRLRAIGLSVSSGLDLRRVFQTL